MAGQAFSCPGCGAPLAIENVYSKIIICQYCGQSCAVSAKGLDPTGKVPLLADFLPILKLGEQVRIDNATGKVLGRVRYEFEDGVWDEWFVRLESGKQVWLHEDEGLFTAYEKAAVTSSVPPFDSFRVGETYDVNNRQMFVVEIGGALLKGGQGELNFRFQPGESMQYVDGNSSGELMSLEFSENEIQLSTGKQVSVESLGLSS